MFETIHMLGNVNIVKLSICGTKKESKMILCHVHFSNAKVILPIISPISYGG